MHGNRSVLVKKLRGSLMLRATVGEGLGTIGSRAIADGYGRTRREIVRVWECIRELRDVIVFILEGFVEGREVSVIN